MAESVKRSQQQNSSKIKKPRNDLIRTTLGTYLKGRNYTATEKFRKSELIVTQTPLDMALSVLIDGEVARPNAFSHSYAFCLNNNPVQVDQQFSRLSVFIQSQTSEIKTELKELLAPLLCHLYIEMLKGRDWRPAFEFLKKYASLVAPIDTVNSSSMAHKINGSTVASSSLLNNEDTSQQQNLSNGNTQIHFLPPDDIAADSRTSETQESRIRESFKELIQILSTITRIQDIENQAIVATFRSCKFQIKLSQKSIDTLKKYLAQHGHVIILQIIQVWFHIEVDEAETAASDDEEDDDDDEDTGGGGSGAGGGGRDDDYTTTDNTADDLFDHIKLEQNSYSAASANLNQSKIIESIKSEDVIGCGGNKSTAGDESRRRNPTKSSETQPLKFEPKLYAFEENIYDRYSALSELVESYEKIENTNPLRVLNIKTNNNRLCSATIDSGECHVAAGFDNSIINLWTLKKSVYYGRKPYLSIADRGCEWSIENCDQHDVYSSSDEDEIIVNRFRRKATTTKRTRWKQFMERRSSQNKFSQNGGLILRGHSSAVTDVLFSHHNPLLYSVSHDLTMRAWKASDYTCAAVYHGHNYPIWCVAESSNGLYLATGSKDTTARLWSTDRQFPLIVYIGHTQDVDAIAFHPNGNYIATGSTDLTVRLWCATSGKLFRVFADCKLPIQAIAFSPDGKYLAAAGEENKIRIFDLAAGSQLTELRNIIAPVTSISWNASSSIFACCSVDGSFRVWNVSELGVETSKSHPTPSTSSSSQNSSSGNSSSSSNLILSSNSTNCKRLIKLQYNNDNSISFIGNS